eukprot:CAMPEP_0195140238 /NCGR_PEP_ID=MMETSP0448-20130528/160818_1 /TAXON_ID=66468 /ORGANISM="Heterocapsa triquestra, Strain CCMP 448" /LENGTH=81 /DNA_ID=CAMNT_0040178569 /DNA_START=322 /DNA_END=564 /DNA_ORIENTATION=-
MWALALAAEAFPAGSRSGNQEEGAPHIMVLPGMDEVRHLVRFCQEGAVRYCQEGAAPPSVVSAAPAPAAYVGAETCRWAEF